MSTREDYPAGVPCWVDTSQPDPVDVARFYSGLFGWQTEGAAAISSQSPGALLPRYFRRTRTTSHTTTTMATTRKPTANP
jgi:hypothetical protein